jgi:hypothetical protein
MRINRSRINESIAVRFWTDRSWVNDNQQFPKILETVTSPIVVCEPNLPDFMEDG